MTQAIHQTNASDRRQNGRRSAVRKAGFLLMALVTTNLSAQQKPTAGYAPVNGIKMYYEVHGGGEPVVLLHGAFMTITNNWAGWISELSKKRKVIAVEMQVTAARRTSHDISPTKTSPTTWPPCSTISKSREPTLSTTAWAEPWRCRLRSAIRTKCEGQSSFRPHSAVSACSRKRSKLSRASRRTASKARR